ncbi:sensor histidine kinase [Ruegeria pomeroyi]|uniref:histidine kinase n=2 Tax=Ruegeria pomeroyi TaxID=89184 RepID=Q5LVJ0_RUEPO|nr:sensor histidine kinase [Ruegeria pomeroyi]AAV94017.1 sensor histidine kinase ChvG [Ruegeria pomeroyi DSS-3]NVK99584.1 sensor histidine kinase [Ruegeria pomeroyi]NVL01041.1 sensor histidine kinase [Ruegeria pomeroyi]QWV07601.1 sensor histidine kinase [Ruegeria pomeroyi]
MRDTGTSESNRSGDVVLGDDWVAPHSTVSKELRVKRARRSLFSLRGSPLTRKIITFNLIALIILVAGILYLNDARNGLVVQRAGALVGETQLVADVFEAQITGSAPVNLATGDGVDVDATLEDLSLRRGVEVFVFDTARNMVGQTKGTHVNPRLQALFEDKTGSTIITDALSGLWRAVSSIFANAPKSSAPALEQQIASLLPEALAGETRVETVLNTAGGTVIAAATPILQAGTPIGAVAMASPAGEIDALARRDRERVLQMFVVALLVSVGLSLVLASTIANPLADLAEAAELGRDRNSRRMNPGRIRIPDLSARPDEIGRLSRALRGMVSALYNRIEGNEQFAADVAHEIKNPLASLQSAVGTLRMVRREDQRDKLLSVIEHDVRRLDRLVSDISNASRLDAELVKEEEQSFNLLTMLDNLNQYLGEDARSKGIDYITDMPPDPIMIQGLEARLAQVFVNLITNAISFCEDGDAIRVWTRRRANRVLIVVEDTGPGIPDEALAKIFKRFYSQRPEEHFGNNSGLGLAISKQIVEAHGGVIWAENIRPTEADVTSDPLGARFVVGLPI